VAARPSKQSRWRGRRYGRALPLPDIGGHADAVSGKCLRQHEGRARPARSRRPRIRHKRASGACSLRASALIEAVVREGRRCRSQSRDERHRPPNGALLLSPRTERVRPGLGATAFVPAPAHAIFSVQRGSHRRPEPGRRRRTRARIRALVGSELTTPLATMRTSRSGVCRSNHGLSPRGGGASSNVTICSAVTTPPLSHTGRRAGGPPQNDAPPARADGEAGGVRVGRSRFVAIGEQTRRSGVSGRGGARSSSGALGGDAGLD
jgi:hypothetical protein